MAENDNDKQSGEAEKDPRLLYAEDEQESGIFRWMSAAVVLLAVAGFFGLAWYAYKSGGEAVDEKDVELVKADKAPVKETPANPGGMQIPNQDKTVYGLISGNKTDKPTVERILPAPEEPMARGGDTETWMSDKAKSKVNGEEAITPAAASTAPAAAPAAIETAPSEAKKAEQFNPAPVQTAQNKQNDTPTVAPKAQAPVTPPAAVAKPAVAMPTPTIAAAPEVKPAAAIVKAAPVVAKPKAEADDAAPAPAADAKAPPKGARVQLGAYKSEAEAKNNWTKIAKQFGNELNGKEHYVVRADLGDKGVYYRLQVAPFASAKEGEEFCLTFVSAGQNCFLAKAK